VQVISGQELPKPKASGAKGNTVDPYVTVEVFGIPADCAEERTKTLNNTGMINVLRSCVDVTRDNVLCICQFSHSVKLFRFILGICVITCCSKYLVH